MSQFNRLPNFTTTTVPQSPLPSPAHIMPRPPSDSVPWRWNAELMPWTVSKPYSQSQVMKFNAISTQPSSSSLMPSTPFSFLNQSSSSASGYKRKSDVPLPTPSKQFITEEKMAAHLNGLHISPDYVSHDATTNLNNPNNINSVSTETATTTNDLSSDIMDTMEEYHIPLSLKEFEEKLKNASKITICDEIKMLNEHDTILPKALLSRIEKPCTALVLWKPPQKLEELTMPKNSNDKKIVKNNSGDEFESIDENVDDENIEDQHNNNTSTLDYNCGMETDMF